MYPAFVEEHGEESVCAERRVIIQGLGPLPEGLFVLEWSKDMVVCILGS